MKGWFECSECGHQYESAGPKISSNCPKCGCDSTSRCEVGNKQPDWYSSSAEPKSFLGMLRAALKRKP